MTSRAASLLHQLRTLTAVPGAASLSDRELLRRFLAAGDEAAFTALVERHASMVLRVCRRVLGNVQDVEDAFQAVFLVLVRKARFLRGRETLGGWLHETAHRLALRARADDLRRRAREI